MDPKPVKWNDVAKYVIAVVMANEENSPGFNDELSKLKKVADEGLLVRLKNFRSNRAANRLNYKKFHYSWTLREMDLGALNFRPPIEPRRHRTVQQFIEIDWPRMPEKEQCKWRGKVEPEVRTLVAHQEWVGSDLQWYLGDGYHRAVALFLEGLRTVKVYAGECIAPKMK